MKKRTPRIHTAESTISNEQPINTSANGTSQLIALKAYELWEQDGRKDGHALEYWLRAEAITTKHD
jgi:hypothetical protein